MVFMLDGLARWSTRGFRLMAFKAFKDIPPRKNPKATIFFLLFVDSESNILIQRAVSVNDDSVHEAYPEFYRCSIRRRWQFRFHFCNLGSCRRLGAAHYCSYNSCSWCRLTRDCLESYSCQISSLRGINVLLQGKPC